LPVADRIWKSPDRWQVMGLGREVLAEERIHGAFVRRRRLSVVGRAILVLDHCRLSPEKSPVESQTWA
jgi:hypothetical protein